MYVTWETILTCLKLPVIVLCDLPLNLPRAPCRKTPVFIWDVRHWQGCFVMSMTLRC